MSIKIKKFGRVPWQVWFFYDKLPRKFSSKTLQTMFAKLGRKTSYQGRRWILQLMYEAGLIQPVKKGGHFWQPMFPDLDSYFKVIRRELNFELGGMDINLVVQDANGENVI